VEELISAGYQATMAQMTEILAALGRVLTPKQTNFSESDELG
jgi:hypothetical protein